MKHPCSSDGVSRYTNLNAASSQTAVSLASRRAWGQGDQCQHLGPSWHPILILLRLSVLVLTDSVLFLPRYLVPC